MNIGGFLFRVPNLLRVRRSETGRTPSGAARLPTGRGLRRETHACLTSFKQGLQYKHGRKD